MIFLIVSIIFHPANPLSRNPPGPCRTGSEFHARTTGETKRKKSGIVKILQRSRIQDETTFQGGKIRGNLPGAVLKTDPVLSRIKDQLSVGQ